MTGLALKTTCLTALIITSYITFCLVAINIGFVADFIWLWLRSWLIAFALALPSLLFLAPFIRKLLNC